MAKFEMYQQFENRKNGRVAHVEKVDDTYKTIILIYDEMKDGDAETGLCLSYPSVSKSWKRLDTYYSSNNEQEAETGEQEAETAGDGTAYAEVMQEILADEKQAVKEIKKGKKKTALSSNTNPQEIERLCDFIFSEVTSRGAEIFTPANGMKMRTFKVGGHMFAKFNFSSKSVTLACRSAAVSIEPDKTVNHLFNNLYVFTNMDETVKIKIKTLLDDAYNHQYLKNEKANKEEK